MPLGKARAQVLLDLREVELSLGGAGRDHVVDLGVPLGMQRGEAQVFELLLQLPHAEAMRQRCVDVHRLVGGSLLLFRRDRGDGAHVVHPVGELDDQHADVLGHRDEHLAHRRRLLLGLRVEVDPFEFGDAVHEFGNGLTELLRHLLDRHARVLDRVVEQRRDHGVLVHAVPRGDARDGEGVGHVRLTGLAGLAGVDPLRNLVGTNDPLTRFARVELAIELEHALDLDRRGQMMATPRKDPGHRGHPAPSVVDKCVDRALTEV